MPLRRTESPTSLQAHMPFTNVPCGLPWLTDEELKETNELSELTLWGQEILEPDICTISCPLWSGREEIFNVYSYTECTLKLLSI